MIPEEIIAELGSLSRAQRPEALPWTVGKLIQILQVQESKIEALEQKIAELENR